jgi:PEP-CTERM motif
MKKFVLSSLFLVALAGTASAALISPCAVLMLPNSTGNTGSSCSATPDSGDFISSLTITITDDYTGYQSGNPVVSYSGTLNQSTNVFQTTPLTLCSVSTTSSNSTPCLNNLGAVTGLDLSSYSVNLTNAGNSLAGGVVTGASEVMTLSYTESPIVVGAPEPSTLSMLGGALLGLGFLGRKKKA